MKLFFIFIIVLFIILYQIAYYRIEKFKSKRNSVNDTEECRQIGFFFQNNSLFFGYFNILKYKMESINIGDVSGLLDMDSKNKSEEKKGSSKGKTKGINKSKKKTGSSKGKTKGINKSN